MSRNETRRERIGTTTKKEKLRKNDKEGDKTRKNGTKQQREGQKLLSHWEKVKRAITGSFSARRRADGKRHNPSGMCIHNPIFPSVQLPEEKDPLAAPESWMRAYRGAPPPEPPITSPSLDLRGKVRGSFNSG